MVRATPDRTITQPRCKPINTTHKGIETLPCQDNAFQKGNHRLGGRWEGKPKSRFARSAEKSRSRSYALSWRAACNLGESNSCFSDREDVSNVVTTNGSRASNRQRGPNKPTPTTESKVCDVRELPYPVSRAQLVCHL